MLFKDDQLSQDPTQQVTGNPQVGEVIEQTQTDALTGASVKARAYVASFDEDTKVLKYFTDRSLNYSGSQDQTDYIGISTLGRHYSFTSSDGVIEGKTSGFKGYVNNVFTGITTNPTGNKQVDLGMAFTEGLAKSEINKGSGELVYIDHRPLIARNERQKEDVKIILEF